jgi:chromosome segregation ATPase
MNLADWFRREFLAVEHAAESLVHTAEKELEMVSQAFADAIARIKAALASHADQSAADAKTISDLQGQLSDLQAKCAGHEATIADLTQKLSDATSQIADMEQALLDAAPPAA